MRILMLALALLVLTSCSTMQSIGQGVGVVMQRMGDGLRESSKSRDITCSTSHSGNNSYTTCSQ